MIKLIRNSKLRAAASVLTATWLSAAGAVAIEGRIQNMQAAQRLLGQGAGLVILASFSSGQIVGHGPPAGDMFSVGIPPSFKPVTRPLNLCAGVRATPSQPKTYVAEGMVLYSSQRNMAALLVQADHPTEPTRRSQWMYSDRAASLRGACQGLNTSYDLQLRKGWTAVMTVSLPGRFVVKNATPGLPYWVVEPFTSGARQVYASLFDGR